MKDKVGKSSARDSSMNLDNDEEIIKISGTKWYIDIEYKGQIARFGGDMCLNGFDAIASSMSWVKHIGALREGEQLELMRATHQYSKSHKQCMIRFYDDEDKEIKF